MSLRADWTPWPTKDGKVSIARRNHLRTTVCPGCRHDYYNWPKPQDSVGVEVREDGSCWHMVSVDLRRPRRPCKAYSRNP